MHWNVYRACPVNCLTAAGLWVYGNLHASDCIVKNTTTLIPQRDSLVAKTVNVLKTRMASGYWDGFLPSERHLATQLMVSRSTVVTALRLLQKEEIIERAHGKRTRISKGAVKRLTEGLARHVCVLSPVPTHQMSPKHTYVLLMLQKYLMRMGWDLKFRCRSVDTEDKGERTLTALTDENPGACWLLVGAASTTQAWFARCGLAAVAFGNQDPEIPICNLCLDYRAVCRHAAGRLLALGHEELALVAASETAYEAREAWQGLEEARASHKRGTIHLRKLTYTSGLRELEAWLNGNRPTGRTPGIIAMGAYPALNLYHHIQVRGFMVGKDVSFIATDHDPVFPHLTPSLAHYNLSGKASAKAILKYVTGYAGYNHLPPEKAVLLYPQWVAGDSVCQRMLAQRTP